VQKNQAFFKDNILELQKKRQQFKDRSTKENLVFRCNKKIIVQSDNK
jgi:hypothetical protein